ncbi:hypothetical protein ACHAWF_005593 [Thalassiosira exigua]
MTMKMAALQPEEITVDSKAGHDMIGDAEEDKRGPDSPDGVEGLHPAPADGECELESDDESGSESEPDSEEEEEKEGESMPDGDTNADLHALLAFSKSRLEKAPQPPPTEPAQLDEEEGAASDDENSETAANGDERGGGRARLTGESSVTASPSSPDEEKKIDSDVGPAGEAFKDQAYYIEQAMKKAKQAEKKVKSDDEEWNLLKIAQKKFMSAEEMAKNDDDPEYNSKIAEKKVESAEEKAKLDDEDVLLKIAERKLAEAEEKAKNDGGSGNLLEVAKRKAKLDEESTEEVEAKPVRQAKPPRSENSELWALLNYSKMRLETGATPQVGNKKSSSKNSSVKGDDNMSVSSKLSKSSKGTLGSKRSITRPAQVAVVGGPGDLAVPPDSQPSKDAEADKFDAPFPNVTDNGDASVDGSVSLESGTKHSAANRDESESESEDEDDESSSEEEEEEEEDELPDFLKDSGEEAVDPEEVKQLYEAAKFKAAAILSVSEEKLTDVQMLQAIAIAQEAARKGDEKFSTKRSLFKLNEAKVEDLKSFLNLSFASPKNSENGGTAKNEQTETVGWGIGRVRTLFVLLLAHFCWRQKYLTLTIAIIFRGD